MNKNLQTIVKSTNTFNRVIYNAGETNVSDVASIDVMKFLLDEYSSNRTEKFTRRSAILFDIELFESANDVLKYAKPLEASVKGYVRQLMHMVTVV